MTVFRKKVSIDQWLGKEIPRSCRTDVKLPISESYSGISLNIPLCLLRAEEDGPVVFITAALHGDELNGTGAIRHLLSDDLVSLKRGCLILVPILNLLAFDRHSRYLPDRRDLNRHFPGSDVGSLASRMAHQVFTEIVHRSDFGIDLHTASVRRTNYPNVRADLRDEITRKLAFDFGAELVLDSPGPKGSLRREACRVGCPTIVMEGGEVWKVEPRIVETAVRGIKNVLIALNMIDGEIDRPETQVAIARSQWIRADRGGFLQFHVRPGQIIEAKQPLATNTDLLGRERSVLTAPFDGVILGMTTLPAISPGEPVCHVGKLPKGTLPDQIIEARSDTDSLEERLVEELSSNVLVTERDVTERDASDHEPSA